MKVLNVMAREHEAIGRIVGRLEAEVEALTERGEADGEALERLLAFLEQEVDGHHQEKEERILLPRILRRARGSDAELAQRLLEDHADERQSLGRLRTHLAGAARGEPGSVVAVVCFARRYIRQQRDHSQWEQSILSDLAQRVLSERDDLELLTESRRLDQAWGTSVVGAALALESWLDRRRSPVAA